jgi:hypothetical protein
MLAVLGSAHAYIWQRFVDAPAWPQPWRALATLAIVCLAPGLPLASYYLRRLSRAAAMPLFWIVYTWFGCAVYLLLAAAITHVACAVAPVDPRSAAIVGLVAVAVTIVYGIVHVQRGPRVKHVRVPLARLPASADGYKIAHLTDVHIGPMLGAAFAEDVVAKVNALAPDLIVITGDLVDGRLAELAPHIEPLR